MGFALNALQSARETADRLTPSPEAIRAAAMDTIHGAYSTLRGSGSLMTELGNVKDAAIGMVSEPVGGALRAAGQLLTLQPIKATQTLATGLTDTCKNLARFTTAPIPVALAAAENTYRTTRNAASTVARLPKTAVLKGINVVGSGVNQVLDLFGPNSSESDTPKAPDLGGPVPPVTAPQAV